MQIVKVAACLLYQLLQLARVNGLSPGDIDTHTVFGAVIDAGLNGGAVDAKQRDAQVRRRPGGNAHPAIQADPGAGGVKHPQAVIAAAERAARRAVSGRALTLRIEDIRPQLRHTPGAHRGAVFLAVTATDGKAQSAASHRHCRGINSKVKGSSLLHFMADAPLQQLAGVEFSAGKLRDKGLQLRFAQRKADAVL